MLQGVVCDDAQQTLQIAGRFLEADALRSNVILTLLGERLADRQPMRAWILRSDTEIAGIAFQSPLAFDVNLVMMSGNATDAMARLISDSGIALKGVRGPAATVARFAGAWLDLTGVGSLPVDASRILEAVTPASVPLVSGELRCATIADREVVLQMMLGFFEETGERPLDFDLLIEKRLKAGHYWIWWAEEGAISLAGVSDPVAGVVRIQAAYTQPRWRNRAYASACVGTLTAGHQQKGHRCVLYTALDNPVSNRAFTNIGYRPVGEQLRYQFIYSA